MKFTVTFIERKPTDTVSLERVFEQIGKDLKDVEVRFQKLPFGNSILGILLNLLLFRRIESDVYHITGHVHYIGLRLPKDRTVLTVHDLGILHTRKGLRRFIIKKLFYDWPVKRLRYITAISNFTKRELMKHTGCDDEKVRVIENPMREDFLTEEREFNSERPTILQIGTAPHKNLNNLITALEGIACKLKIVGPLDNKAIDLLRTNKISYENLCSVDEAGIRNAYVDSDIVAFCSTYEGFGLPIIEAQATGRPVVTSDLSPMKDVAGQAAMLVDPYEPDSIRTGILALKNDAALRDELISKGAENVKRFSADRIAELYRSLYMEVLTNAGQT